MSTEIHEPTISTQTKNNFVSGALVAIVIFLALGLAGQWFYISKLKNDQSAQLDHLKQEMSEYLSSRQAPSHAVQPQARYYPQQSVPAMMTASVWDPFHEMEQMQARMNRMFNDSFSRGFFQPQATPFQNRTASRLSGSGSTMEDLGDRYLLKLEIPGMEKDRLSINVTDDYVKVSGEHRSENEQSDAQNGIYQMQQSFGHFERAFPLPSDVDSTAVNANYEEGVLAITMPKIVPDETVMPKARQVAIQ